MIKSGSKLLQKTQRVHLSDQVPNSWVRSFLLQPTSIEGAEYRIICTKLPNGTVHRTERSQFNFVQSFSQHFTPMSTN